MKDNKYICPECGAKIEYWKDYLRTKTQGINPLTGKLNNTVKKSKEDEMDGMTGLKCTKCKWLVNDVSQGLNDLFTDWYEDNKNDLQV